MRVVVTGGAGFIGSHVADAFVARGDDVLVVDNLSTGTGENVPEQAAFEELDIVDVERLRSSFFAFKPEVICHLAAQASVTVSMADPARDLAVNVEGTFNVCEAARDLVKSVVFASTGGALYGDGAPTPTPEDYPPEPLSPYGASKLAGEAYVGTWGRLHGPENVVLRLSNVYGPRQSPHGEAGVVAIFSDRLLRGEAPIVYGHGRPTRDYVHVTDIAAAFVLAAEHRVRGTFNVGSGKETSVLELLEVLQRAAGTSIEPQLEPLRPGELERSALDSTQVHNALKWSPTISFEDGIAETYRWYADSAR